jgi:hypothetical protein
MWKPIRREPAQVGEQVVLLGQVVHLWVREVLTGLTALDSGQRDQLIRVTNRQLPQHQGVDEAKDRRVRANPESEGQNRD